MSQHIRISPNEDLKIILYNKNDEKEIKGLLHCSSAGSLYLYCTYRYAYYEYDFHERIDRNIVFDDTIEVPEYLFVNNTDPYYYENSIWPGANLTVKWCEAHTVNPHRRPLVRPSIISRKYSSLCIYRGRNGYHNSHGPSFKMNTPKKLPDDNVYIGFEMETHARPSNRLIRRVQSNIVFSEDDCSLGNNGYEWITVPLLPKDAMNPKFISKITEKIGPTTYVDDRCGLHVHISKAFFSPEELYDKIGQLKCFFYHYLFPTDLNDKVNRRHYSYSGNPSYNTENLKYECLSKTEISNVTRLYNRSDRRNIYTGNDNTIEFRQGAGTTDPKLIAIQTTYYYYLMKYIKDTPWKESMNFNNFVNYLKANLPERNPLKQYVRCIKTN